MATKIWQFLGSIRLSFWLLISGAGVLFIGSHYTNIHFSFFQTLSQTPIQTWLWNHLPNSPERVWWIPILFGIMGLLGLNILVCAFQRISKLFAQKGKDPGLDFFNKLTPSIIHLLFPIVLAGHLMTFTLAHWQRMPIETGKTLRIGETPMVFEPVSIVHSYYPKDTLMKDRISQTTVEIKNKPGRIFVLKHLHPVKVDGQYLYLDMIKKRGQNKTAPPAAATADEENCNKAHVYHTEKKATNDPKLLLLTVRDPGLYPICFGLSTILILMTWYFCYPIFNKKKP